MLIAFTLYVPENSGLERFTYLAYSALREFIDDPIGRPVVIQRVRGEQIPLLVDEQGGYGWTGNDLFSDYKAANKGASLRIVKKISWPEEIKPRLCLLGPDEYNGPNYDFCNQLTVAVADKYKNLAGAYFERMQWYPPVTFINGQVDRQIRQGKADLAIDIVYSGRTIREERLSIYDVIFDEGGLVLLTKDNGDTTNKMEVLARATVRESTKQGGKQK